MFGVVADQARAGLIHVDAADTEIVVHGAAVVLYGNNLCTVFGERSCRRRAHVSETLYRDARAFERERKLLRDGARNDNYAATGGVGTSETTAKRYGLSGNNSRSGPALIHRVGVHHPGHHLLVRIHVRRGNVAIRSEQDIYLAGVTPRQPFEFGN